MKLDLDTNLSNQNHIRCYEPGKIVVNNTTFDKPFVILADKILRHWAVHKPDQISFEDLSVIIDEKPELIIIGSGDSMIFPQPALIAEVQTSNIGLEVMNTGAACRCFNLLLLEKRSVAAIMYV